MMGPPKFWRLKSLADFCLKKCRHQTVFVSVFNNQSHLWRCCFSKQMALNESSEADVGWQISMPSEDEKLDEIDDDLDLNPEHSPGSRWSRRSSHSVESGTQVTLMDEITGSSELCACFFLNFERVLLIEKMPEMKKTHGRLFVNNILYSWIIILYRFEELD